MRRRRSILAGLTLAVALTSHPVAVSAEATKVRATRAVEFRPAASEGFLAWSQSPRNNLDRITARVKPDGEGIFRVNPAGTQGWVGGTHEEVLAYQQVRGGSSRIRLFDMGTRSHLPVPAGVNTNRWEWLPSISQGHLLFNRFFPRTNRSQVVLVDRADGSSGVVATATRGFLQGTQVIGDHAVWVRCRPAIQCRVFRFTISTGDVEQVPKPERAFDSSPSVDPSGTVYFARSGPRCGRNATIRRHVFGDGTTLLQRLPRNLDVESTFVLEDGTGTRQVLFGRFHCIRTASDVYKVVDGSEQ